MIYAFSQGYTHPDEKNPHLPTSDNSGAWLLGKYFADNKLPMPKSVTKSHGYNFRVDGELYCVERNTEVVPK